MQLTINDVSRQPQVQTQEAGCHCFDVRSIITTIALAALLGTVISLATGNFVAAIVCASILGAAVILNIAICCLKISQRKEQEIQPYNHVNTYKPTIGEFVQSPEDQLDSALLEQAKLLVDDARNDRLPKPTIGIKSRQISMPEGIPVVIRTHNNPEERLISICEGRKIATDNGLSHVIFPKVTMWKSVLFEDRVDAVGHKSAMSFYYMNPELFNESAPEFAIILSQCKLNDIIGGDRNDKDTVFPLGMPRYDNVMLLKNGDISPIDLDTFKLKTVVQRKDYVKAAKKAISLFPYQFEQIINKLQEKMNDSFKAEELEQLKKARDMFNRGLEEEIGKHYKFLQGKLEKKNLKPLEISPENYDQIEHQMSEALINLNAKDPEYLGKNPNPIVEHFKEFVFPHMIAFIKEIIFPKIEEISLEESEVTPELLSKRRFQLKLDNCYNDYIHDNNLTFKVDEEVEKSFPEAERTQYRKKKCLEGYHTSNTILNMLLDRLIDVGLIANTIEDNGYKCTTIYY